MKIPVTMLISSSWERRPKDPSDRLELAELYGKCSEGQGDGGPKWWRVRVPIRLPVALPQTLPPPTIPPFPWRPPIEECQLMPERRFGLYKGGPRKGTVSKDYSEMVSESGITKHTHTPVAMKHTGVKCQNHHQSQPKTHDPANRIT